MIARAECQSGSLIPGKSSSSSRASWSKAVRIDGAYIIVEEDNGEGGKTKTVE